MHLQAHSDDQQNEKLNKLVQDNRVRDTWQQQSCTAKDILNIDYTVNVN